MAKTHEVAFKLGASIASNFTKTMSTAAGAMKKLGQQTKQLSQQQKSIQQVLKLRESVSKAAQDFTKAQQHAKQLAAALKSTSAPTQAMARDHERAQAAVEKARSKLQQETSALQQVSAAAGLTGRSTAQLVNEQNKLAKSAERASKAQKALQKNKEAKQANLADRGEKRGQLFDAVAMGASLAAPIKIAMDFEAAMSKVGAVSQASAGDMQKLTTQAKQLGATTAWSASEAAGGMAFLAMSGFKTEQTMAAMPGVLNLASAAGADLATTADIASNMISGFQLKAGDMGRVADVMTNTFTSSNTTLEGLGETMKYVAPIAATAGVSIETVAAMSGKLGDNAISAGQAGTALRSIINRMAGPPAEAAKALDKLGISTKDAQGNLREMPTVLAEIHRATKNLGSAEKLEMFKAIAGTEAGSAFAVLVNEAGSGNLQKFQADLGKTGSALRVSQQMLDNTKGAVIQMKSALEGVAITIGSILLPVVADMANKAAGMMTNFIAFADANPQLVTALTLTAAALMAAKVAAIAGGYAFTFVKGAYLSAKGAVLTLRANYVLLTTAMNAQRRAAAMAAISTHAMAAAQWVLNSALFANPIGLIIAAVVALVAVGVLLYKKWDMVVAFFQGAWQGLSAGIAPVLESFSFMSPVIDVAKAAFSSLGSILGSVVGWLMQTGSSTEQLAAAASYGQMFGVIVAGAINTLTAPIRGAIALIQFLVGAFAGLPATASAAFNQIVAFASSINLYESGRKILTTLADGIRAAVGVAVGAMQGAMNSIRSYLPFSDAKKGPLSDLTLSGSRVLTTFAHGMDTTADAPMQSLNASLGSMASGLAGSAPGAGAGGGMSFTITQEIVMGPGGAYAEAKAGASAGAEDLINQIQNALGREQRLSYG